MFEGFVKICQIKANYANGWVLQWDYEKPTRVSTEGISIFGANLNRLKENSDEKAV